VRSGAPNQLPLVPALVAAALIAAGVVTLGAPLVPEIQAAYGVSEESAQWSYTVTLLVGATCTPLLGRLADGRLRRGATVTVCGLVSVGCLLSGFATSFALFLLGRSLQGLAVGLVAMTIATARDHLRPSRVARVVALLSVTTALGAGISYPLTTWVTETFGLDVAFLGAAVLSAIVTLAVGVSLPRVEDDTRRRRLDIGGAVLLILGSGTGLLALSQGNGWGWLDPLVVILAAGSLVTLALWVWAELRVSAPLVELRLFRNRNVLAANLTAVLMGVSLYSLPVLMSRIGQAPTSTGYGGELGLVAIGVILTPIAIGNLLGSWAASAVLPVAGTRLALAAGGLLALAGPAVLIAAGGQAWALVVAISLSSLGSGATFGTMPNLIVAAVAPTETGSATSMNILLRAVGGALGSAGTAAVLGAYPGPLPGFATGRGVDLALGVCVMACVASVVVSLTVPQPRRAGGRSAEPSERRPVTAADRQSCSTAIAAITPAD
jgi:MFS family permease